MDGEPATTTDPRVALSLGALAVFFVHLFAFGILAVTVAAYELVVFSTKRGPFAKRVIDLFVAALPFLPAIALLILFSPHSSSSAIIKYRDLWTRILAFAAPILYDWHSEAVSYCILGALLLWVVLTGQSALTDAWRPASSHFLFYSSVSRM